MKTPPPARLWLAIALALAPLAPRDARADDARTAAQALFDEAMKRMEEHAYDQGCPKLEEVVNLSPGKVGALLELARCYEEWGKTASAWRWYRAAAHVAARLFDPREASTRKKVDELGLRLPRLLIAVASTNRVVEGLTVQLDGHDLGLAEWANALPVDPGRHVVVVSAPGKQSWKGSIAVWPGLRTVPIGIPALEDALRPTAPPAPTALSPSQGAPPSVSAPVWPWVVGGLGIASLGVAAGFGLDGLSANSSLNGLCVGHISFCPSRPTSEVDPLNARMNRGLGMFVGFGAAGVAAMEASIVGLANRPKAADALVVTPVVGHGFAGVGVGGGF